MGQSKVTFTLQNGMISADVEWDKDYDTSELYSGLVGIFGGKHVGIVVDGIIRHGKKVGSETEAEILCDYLRRYDVRTGPLIDPRCVFNRHARS